MDGFNPALISSRIRVMDSSTLVGAASTVQLAAPDANRVLITFSCNGSNFTLGVSTKIGGGIGWLITAGALPFVIDFARYPGIVGGPFYAISAGGAQVYVVQGIWLG